MKMHAIDPRVGKEINSLLKFAAGLYEKGAGETPLYGGMVALTEEGKKHPICAGKVMSLVEEQSDRIKDLMVYGLRSVGVRGETPLALLMFQAGKMQPENSDRVFDGMSVTAFLKGEQWEFCYELVNGTFDPFEAEFSEPTGNDFTPFEFLDGKLPPADVTTLSKIIGDAMEREGLKPSTVPLDAKVVTELDRLRSKLTETFSGGVPLLEPAIVGLAKDGVARLFSRNLEGYKRGDDDVVAEVMTHILIHDDVALLCIEPMTFTTGGHGAAITVFDDHGQHSLAWGFDGTAMVDIVNNFKAYDDALRSIFVGARETLERDNGLAEKVRKAKESFGLLSKLKDTLALFGVTDMGKIEIESDGADASIRH